MAGQVKVVLLLHIEIVARKCACGWAGKRASRTQGWTGAHRKEHHVHCPGVPSCLCCGSADTLVPPLPEKAGAGFGSVTQGVLNYRNIFEVILSLVL